MKEFLVELSTVVPEGTAPAEADRLFAAERVRAGELAAAGTLRRLWRPAGKPTLGLFHAADETELREKVLDTLPLRPWMTLQVTALEPHPNDPGAAERA
jgi:muconolactone D-isomerase